MTDSDQPTPPEDGTENTELCAQCGASIDTSEWHPVVAEDGDGFQLYPFCDESCREEWE